jgi:excisionase family DNA binding protein
MAEAPLTYWGAAEIGDALGTTTKTVYALIAAHKLPGVFRVGHRVAIKRATLHAWLDDLERSSSARRDEDATDQKGPANGVRALSAHPQQ